MNIYLHPTVARLTTPEFRALMIRLGYRNPPQLRALPRHKRGGPSAYYQGGQDEPTPPNDAA